MILWGEKSGSLRACRELAWVMWSLPKGGRCEVFAVSAMKLFSKSEVGLKICGVRRRQDVPVLVKAGVDAVGFNFWPGSKRYLDPAEGRWMRDFGGEILRVGVFVNERGDLPFRLFGEGMIDVVQLHGDENEEDVGRFVAAGIPVIKALGVRSREDLERALGYGGDGVLLDTYAPGVFGGTGEKFDWSLAREFKESHPERTMILAGGITPENAAEAIEQARPDALDVASGAEVSPGVKNFDKVKRLVEACRSMT